MSERERFKEVQLQLFSLAQEQKQLRLRITALKLLVRKLGVTLRKVCKRCLIEMEAEQFYRDPRYTDGLYPYCRECKRNMGREKQNAA